MKHLYLVVALIFWNGAISQTVNIPDTSLKNQLKNFTAGSQKAKNLAGQWTAIDTNGNGEIEVSEAEQISFVNVSCQTGLPCTSIGNLTGMEAFVNLEYFYCDNNSIASLAPLSGLTNLKHLGAGGNSISSLSLSTTALEFLTLSQNNFTSLNLSMFPNLKELYISSMSNLSSLDMTGLTGLERISMYGTALSNFDFTPFTALKYIHMQSCGFTSLDVSTLVNLEELYCHGLNYFTTLDLSGNPNLRKFNASGTPLTSLDFSSCPLVEQVHCYQCNLQELNLTGCNALNWLRVSENSLSELEITSPVIYIVDVADNNLSFLDLSNKGILESMNCANNNLQGLSLKGSIHSDPDMGDFFVNFEFSGNPDLQYICVDDSRINQVKNRANSYGYDQCVVNSYCSFVPGGVFYTIAGVNQFDADNNGCDVSDPSIPFLKYAITGGSTAGTIISDASGDYSIPVQAGNHLITPILENPAYFTVSPASINVHFPTETSPFNQNFCFSPNGVHPDVEISIMPVINAVPGFDASYKIVYHNKGNQQQSGVVNLSYNDVLSDFVSSLPTVSSQSAGNLQWNFTDLSPFETRTILFTLNLSSPMDNPPLNAGETLMYSVSIDAGDDETVQDNTAILNHYVVNSFDPNDKTCLEGNVISPETVGEYVHYLIRFENTGSAPAQNIVVKDMIDLSKFDITTLTPFHSSHPVVTRITSGNKVEFIFENIQLPFDDENNDGYVLFKIKTLPTLQIGDSFSNTAEIFFDFNFPIVTNTATTTVQTLSTSDYEFGSDIVVYPNPSSDMLNVSANGISIKEVNIYNQLGQLVLKSNSMSMDVSSLMQGSYIVKVVADGGVQSLKFVKK